MTQNMAAVLTIKLPLMVRLKQAAEVSPLSFLTREYSKQRKRGTSCRIWVEISLNRSFALSIDHKLVFELVICSAHQSYPWGQR